MELLGALEKGIPTGDSMSEPQKGFDWFAFFVRVVVIAALATWLLIKRLHSHDRPGAILVVVTGYLIVPFLAYLHTRYYNSVFMFGIAEAVRRRVGGRAWGIVFAQGPGPLSTAANNGSSHRGKCDDERCKGSSGTSGLW